MSSPAPDGVNQAPHDAAERIAEILDAQQSEQHLPGFAFALVQQGRIELVLGIRMLLLKRTFIGMKPVLNSMLLSRLGMIRALLVIHPS